MAVDPVALTEKLVQCPSVTPEEGGALQHLEALLSVNGFHCVRVDRGNTPNLFARWGTKARRGVLGSTATPMWCRLVTWMPGPIHRFQHARATDGFTGAGRRI